MSRRERKVLRRQGKRYKAEPESKLASKNPVVNNSTPVSIQDHTVKHSKKYKNSALLRFYDKNYKKSMWITILLLVVSILIIGGYAATHNGEIIPRGVTLKGGVTLTIQTSQDVNTDNLQDLLRTQFPDSSINVRGLSLTGESIGFIVDASDIEGDTLLDAIEGQIGGVGEYSLETMGSSLGQAFFRQTLLAIIAAFILMSIVVFISFRTFVPSFAVVLSAVSDILMTVAVVDLFGIKLETAGIAALLMLIGYSVDTDVLLTTRVVKRQEGTVIERVLGAMKTGMTMTVTSIAAIVVALIFTQSEVLRQIMIILLIGLIFDILNTWIQNVGILRMYMEYKSKKEAKNTLKKHNVADSGVEE